MRKIAICAALGAVFSCEGINYQEVTNQTVNGDRLAVTVQDFSGDEIVGESYTRSYSL